MAQYVSRFVIGVILAADSDGQNPKINITDGVEPYTGSVLNVETWRGVPRVAIIMGSLLLAHGILFVGATAVANTVVVRDDSYLSCAKLLRHVVAQEGEAGGGGDGTVLKGQQIVTELTSAGRGHIDYGFRGVFTQSGPRAWDMNDGDLSDVEIKQT